MEIIGYLGAVFAGLSLGLIGGGGSILIMPILIYLFHITPTLSTTYSLFIVGLASVIGAIQYQRSREINYQIGLLFLLPSMVGVLISRQVLLPRLPEEIYQLGNLTIGKSFLILVVFTVLMLTVSIRMILRQRKAPKTEEELKRPAFSRPWFVVKSLGIGVLTGFVGAGGGFLIIPALVVLGNLPMRVAVGTSLFIISINSLTGFFGDFSIFSAMNWSFLLSITVATSLGIFIGKQLSERISSEKLAPLFGWFVLAVGLYILAKEAIMAFS